MIKEEIRNFLPADVPQELEKSFLENFEKTTNGSGRLMLFAGVQKVEHLNNDFYGPGIFAEDNDPEHLFKIASRAKIGVFATKFGLISRYVGDYKDVPFLIKLNSKTDPVPYDAKAPYSRQWLEVEDVLTSNKAAAWTSAGWDTPSICGRAQARDASRSAPARDNGGALNVPQRPVRQRRA